MTALPLTLALALALPPSAPPPAAASPGPADGAVALTLDEALAEAARSASDVRLSGLDGERARQDLVTAQAGLLPRLDLQASAGHAWTGAQRTALGFGTPPVTAPAADEAAYGLGLTLQLPLFDGLRNLRTVEQAEAAGRAASHGLDEARLAVAFETLRRYLEVLKAQESLTVLVEAAARSAENVGRAEALFEAGRGGRLDVLTARGNLGTDRIAVARDEARLASARADLSEWLGRRGGEPPVAAVAPSSVAGPPAPGLAPPPSPESLLARARRDRPLLASRAEAERAAELGERIAGGAFWPTVSAQASYDRQSTDLAGSYGVLGDPGRQYSASAGLVLAWNLFDGHRTRADVERAAIARRRAGVDTSTAEAAVAAEIARARAALVAQARAAALAQDDLALAESGVALAKDRLVAGAATQLEARDASLKLTQARLDLLTARVDAVVARADLARAVGGELPLD